MYVYVFNINLFILCPSERTRTLRSNGNIQSNIVHIDFFHCVENRRKQRKTIALSHFRMHLLL